MRQHTVLLFAYHFPPDHEIGAARPFRFFKYLSRLGFSCKVITATPQGNSPADNIHYVPDPFVPAKRLSLNWHIERVIRRILLPGVVGLGWSLAAYRTAREILEKATPGKVTVISTFPPLGVHLAAWRLASAVGLPWIADFRDPLGGLPSNVLSASQQNFRLWLEGRIIRSADAVIANTDACQQHWQRQHPNKADTIHVVWNGFDPENRISAKPLPSRDYKVLCHTGSLYNDRTIGPVLESVDRLIEGNKIPHGSLRVRLVGDTEPAALGNLELVERAQSRGWLELTPNAVPQLEAQEIMTTADFLLLILPRATLQVSGKLFDYIQTGRPILAYIQPNSPVEKILVRSGVTHRCIYPEDSPYRMDQVIQEFLGLPAVIKPGNSWFEDSFNGEAQTQALATIIDKTASILMGKTVSVNRS